MLWGVLSSYGMGPLVPIDGKVNAQAYIGILEQYLLPYLADTMPDGAVFQQDNCPSHTARATMAFFAQHAINKMDWPAQSPDLNIIENVWAKIKRQLYREQHQKLDDVVQRAKELWFTIGYQYINRLLESMPRRCEMVIKNFGYPIDY